MQLKLGAVVVLGERKLLSRDPYRADCRQFDIAKAFMRRVVLYEDFQRSSVAANDPMGRHRVEHLVPDDDTGESRRQAVQPRYSLDEAGRAGGKRVPTAAAQIGAQFEYQ